MLPNAPADLAAFHEFVAEKLRTSGIDLSPEECVDQWRAEHPTPRELETSVAAIREAIKQSGRGEGRPAAEVLAELRSELRLPSRVDER